MTPSKSSDAGVAQLGREASKGVGRGVKPTGNPTTQGPGSEQLGKVSGSNPLPGAEDTPPTKPCSTCDLMDQVAPKKWKVDIDLYFVHRRELHALLASKNAVIREAVRLIGWWIDIGSLPPYDVIPAATKAEAVSKAFLAAHPPKEGT